MNDRYLFKAKRKNWRELPKEEWWVAGLLMKMCNVLHIVEINNEHISHEIILNTICQCTGLKDKNGTLIWENDIIKYTDDIIKKEKVDKITFNETQASFVRAHRSETGLQYLYINERMANECEVVGNVFDNPELLEVER